MLDGHLPLDGGVMAEAFADAGVMSAHERNVRLLAECWERHKPNVTATRKAFSDALTALPGGAQIRDMIGEREWANRISGFTSKNCTEIKKQVSRVNGLNGLLSRYKDHDYSIKRDAVKSRKHKAKIGRVPAHLIEPQVIEQSPVQITNAAAVKAARDRMARGVVLIKAELDTKTLAVNLISRLPDNLQTFATWTKARALGWCETQERYAEHKLHQVDRVRLWCAAAGEDGTLGDYLTEAVVGRLMSTAARTIAFPDEDAA